MFTNIKSILVSVRFLATGFQKAFPHYSSFTTTRLLQLNPKVITLMYRLVFPVLINFARGKHALSRVRTWHLPVNKVTVYFHNSLTHIQSHYKPINILDFQLIKYRNTKCKHSCENKMPCWKLTVVE